VRAGHGSVRFNPNLYNCGKVCLSLLGTWSGEKWNPEVSSMSQVINSILFLILVEQPYFNEPGYQATQGTPSGDSESLKYNRVIRAATLQFAYLDHFRKPNAQLRDYIFPMLCNTWRRYGHATALQWAAEQPALKSHINAIEAEVSKLVGPAPVPVPVVVVKPASAVSGEKASSSSGAAAGAK
jgi:baculoviral IAP repeat-containing protein 6